VDDVIEIMEETIPEDNPEEAQEDLQAKETVECIKKFKRAADEMAH
jgi:hypothetical protein